MLWASYCNLAACSFAKHKYQYNKESSEVVFKHGECKGLAEDQASRSFDRNVCNLCGDVAVAGNGVRSAVRFAIRYWGAKLLHARLFMGPEAQAEIEHAMRATVLYKFQKKNNGRTNWLGQCHLPEQNAWLLVQIEKGILHGVLGDLFGYHCEAMSEGEPG